MPVMDEKEQLQRAIAALEAQRATLGDAVVEAALLPIRDRLAALQAEGAAEQRKLVTVLFADLAGFTAMSEEMDPEDVREVVNAYFRCWTAAIDEYGGELEKFIGDAVMAVFGLSAAHEDDPERAIRAALAMRPLLDALNEKLHQERGLTLSVRVGIHTGPVVVSLLDERRATDFVVVGDSVNLASRLQSAAPAGGVMISHDTYRHVRGLFDVQPLSPLTVKGKREPVQVYLVERPRPRVFHQATRGLDGVMPRMIGRDAEFRELQQALEEVIARRQPQLVTVVGDAGIGKSRLLYEFDSWLQRQPQRIRLFRARADPSRLYTAYSLLHSFFTFHFAIQDSDPAPLVRRKLEESVAAVFAGAPAGLALPDAADIVRASHLIGHLAGFDFGSSPFLPESADQLPTFQSQALRFLEMLFAAMLAGRPAVLLLEDLHWADDSSLDALGQLLASLGDQPLLAVASARASLVERRPAWGQGQPSYRQLALQPLSAGESAALVGAILPLADLPASLQTLIVAQAEGNPFFVEELIKMLVEDGAIARAGDGWQVDTQRLADIRVPPTLVGVLQARLDRLGQQQRNVLQRGAVLGRTFWDRAVSFLGQDGPEDGVTAELLSGLRDRQFVFRREQSTFQATSEYLFKHALLRDVTYDSLLKRQRQAYHRRAAEWLAAVTGSSHRADEYAALIAGHYEHAGELQTAGDWYWRAGRLAAGRYANGEAVHALTKALTLAPVEDTGRRFAITLAREKVYDLLGDSHARLQDLDTLHSLAAAAGDPRWQAQAALRHAAYAFTSSNYPEAVAKAQEAVELAAPPEAAGIAAEAGILQANALMRQGAFADAREHAERSLSLSSQHGWTALEANGLRLLGLIAYYLGDSQQALAHFEQAMHHFARAGDRQGEALAVNNMGGASFNLGDYASAEAYYSRSLQLCRQIGDRLGEGRALNNLGIVAVTGGDYDQGEACYLEGLAIYRQVGHRAFAASALDNLGNLMLYRHEFSRAEHYYRQSIEEARAIGDAVSGSIALLNLGRAYLAVGAYELAGESLRDSLAASHGARHGECHARLALSSLYLETGDTAAALQEAQLALDQVLETDLRSEQAFAYHTRAEARAAQGEFAAAMADFHQALAMRHELGETVEELESKAGLARAALASGDVEQAWAQIQDVVAHVQTQGLLGTTQPARLLLPCYEILHRAGDERAPELLAQGCRFLHSAAAGLEDEAQRRAFLEKVPANRALLAICSEAG